QTVFKGKKADDWDKRSKEMAPRMQRSDYVDEFISRMEISGDEVVLDIGCGPGTLAIPLAQKVKHVIAIDFSRSMLDELEAYAAREGITNITTHHIGWEDDWSTLGHIDIAVASRSMEVEDMNQALLKMSTFAKKACYLTYKVGGSYVDMEIVEHIGKKIITKPDYWYIPLILYSSGHLAKVDYIATPGSIKSQSEEEFVASLGWSLHGLTTEEDTKAREYYQTKVVTQNAHPKPFNWAFISWSTEL
ncbi:MAG: class I SAM-dependent methyltransferase, partial [Sulfurimonadaceae bacterium]|nr:class I SAM-dependent methyltransferase [Sulfurimonadaceae bacterium]